MIHRRSVARPILIAAVLTVCATTALVTLAAATPGALNLGFGSGGIVVTPVGSGANDDQAGGVAIQADGKIVVAGQADPGTGSGVDFAITRYLPGGAPDPEFGAGGKVTTAISTGANNDSANAVLIQPDGKIVAAGHTYTGIGGERRFALVRYLANGAPDPTFGSGGKVVTDVGFVGGGEDVVNALALQPDGKIVAAGRSTMAAGFSDPDFALVRYDGDGNPDATFDGDGIATTAIAPATSAFEHASSVALQPDGKIVAAGYTELAATGGDIAIVRYGPGGGLDMSFSGDGIATKAIGPGTNTDYGAGLALQSDGKAVVGGVADMGVGAGGRNLALLRYDAAGVLDLAFDGDGVVTTAIAPGDNGDEAAGIALQPDGKIVAVGVANMGASDSNKDFAVARYDTAGVLDAGFDGDGTRTTAIGPGSNDDYARAVALQTDGSIIAAGFADPGTASGRDFTLVRYIGLETDLALSRDPGPTKMSLGSKLRNNLTATNFGVDTAPNSKITYVVPQGAELDSATPSQGSCSGVMTIICELGALAPGTSATAQIVVKPTRAGILAGAFSAASQYYDPNLGNNAVASSVKVTNARPDSDIRRLSRKISRGKLKRFRGTASDDYGVAKVEIAIYRQTPGVRAAASCSWLARAGGGFKHPRARNNRCSKPIWLKARGTTRWTFKLKRPLPPGSYVAYARATDKARLVESSYSKRDRNRIAFKVTR